MHNIRVKQFLVFVILSILTISAFIVRLDNFKHTRARTIDEIVFYTLGSQLKDDPLDYNSIPYAKVLMAHGRELPEYFTKPLFKHPPLFSYLISFSLRIFGDSIQSAYYVPLLLGVLMIPLTYLLGSLVFDQRVGLFSAILLWMDPVNIMTGQKVWMGSPIGFFTLLSIFIFAFGLKQNKDYFFVLSGIMSGLATAMRYTGILATFSIILYALIYDRKLFKNKSFLLGLVMPLVILFPWIVWNITVYGSGFIGSQIKLHLSRSTRRDFKKVAMVVVIMGILTFTFKSILRRNNKKELLRKLSNDTAANKNSFKKLSILILVALVGLMHKEILQGLQLTFLPRTSWMLHVFSYEAPTFYFGRLIQYSLLYLFAFAGLFIYQKEEHDNYAALLRLSAFTVLMFFTIWRGYQCRYILPATPFLMILASGLIVQIFERISKIGVFNKRLLFKSLLVLFICYSLFKTSFFNVLVSFTNDFCYF